MDDPYKVGSTVRFSPDISVTNMKKGSDTFRVISQNRNGTVVAFFGTALKWKDRGVTVRFPPMNGKQKEIILYDIPVKYFEEVK